MEQDRTYNELNQCYIRYRKANPELEAFACWCKMGEEVYGVGDDPMLIRDAWQEFVEQRNKRLKKQNKIYKKRKKK